MNTSTVSAKGWVVIPMELRERYGLKKGDKVRFIEYGGVIAVMPALKDPIKESAGMLKGEGSLLEALTKSRRERRWQGEIGLARKKHGRYALDSYALIAFFEGEEGRKQVSELLEQAESGGCELFLNVVNLGEIAYIVERERGLSQAQITLARIDELPVTIVEVDRRLALTAAHLKARCPIAYADCFAAALAQEKDAALVTGDPEFKKADLDASIPIVWLT